MERGEGRSMNSSVRCARIASVFVCLLALGGCARGVAEFQLYNQAFDAQFTQGEAILDSVAKAERILVVRRIRARAVIPDFDPAQATYFVDGTDPAITASVRASLRSLKAYNAALGALANGEAATALTNRIGVLAGNIAGAIAATQGAVGGAAAIPGATQFLSRSDSALKLASPIIQQVATIAAREAFRQQLVAAYPHMRDLLIALRDGTPAMFEILKRARVSRGEIDATLGISAENLATLEKDRAMLAAWVLLLDKSIQAMEAAVMAVLANAPEADLASLSEASVELRVLAEQIKAIRQR